MTTTDKPGDPADKGLDTFVSHRAGYGDDRLARIVDYLRRNPRATLASGEGGMLAQHILLLQARIEGMSGAAKIYEDHYSDARAEIDRLRAILARVRAAAEDELRFVDAQPIFRALDGDA